MPPREALALEEGRAHVHHAEATSSGHAHSHSHSHGVRSRRSGDSGDASEYDAAHDRVHSSGYVNGGMRAAMLGFPGAFLCAWRPTLLAPHERCSAPRARRCSASGPSADTVSRPLRRLVAPCRRARVCAEPDSGRARGAHTRRHAAGRRPRPRGGGGPHRSCGLIGRRCVHGVRRVVRARRNVGSALARTGVDGSRAYPRRISTSTQKEAMVAQLALEKQHLTAFPAEARARCHCKIARGPR